MAWLGRRNLLTRGQDGTFKEEIELKDDDSRLVRLMIDFLYQMDYSDILSSRDVLTSDNEIPIEPESPVAKTVSFYENLGSEGAHARALDGDPGTAFDTQISPEPTEPQDIWSFAPLSEGKKDKRDRKDKKKKKKAQPLLLKDDGEGLDAQRLTVNTQMYALADKYEIIGLKALAKTKFEQAVLQHWFSRAFAHAAELAFSSTHPSDRGLRDVVVSAINQHRELVNYEEWQNLLDSGNGVAWTLVQVLLRTSE